MLVLSDEIQAAIAELCRHYQVQRLALFGSALTPEFDPLRSDVDFLVEFSPRPAAAHADAFFSLLRELETLFQRPVDLVEPTAVRNPYVRRSIDASQRTVYAA
jgi:predicted nucleotidyltransferase